MNSGIKKKILFPTLTLFVGCIFALLLLEVILRLGNLSPSQGLHSVDEKTFKAIPGIWSPGQDFVWEELPALPYHVRINSLGYRGADIITEKQANEFRIFIAGDSYTFGAYVNNDESMPYLIESHMNRACGNKRITVINAGIPGSSIRAQDKMIDRGLILKPDLVAQVFYNNDLDDLADPLWDRLAENRSKKSQFPVSVLWPLLRNTATFNFYLRMREVLRTVKTTESNNSKDNASDMASDRASDRANDRRTESTTEIKSPSSNELKEIYQDTLVKLANKLSNQDIPFVFKIYPGHLDVKGKPANDSLVWAAQTAATNGITTLDLTDTFVQGLSNDIDAGYLLPHDAHASPLGHSLAGSAMAEFLLQQPTVKAFCS